MFTRRDFLMLSALSGASYLLPLRSFAAGATIPAVAGPSTRAAVAVDPAAAGNAREPVTVVVFLRGAMDGLSMLPPLEDPEYAKIRPTIAVTGAAKLRDGFALHPAFTEVRKIFDRGEALFLFEAGSPAATRSHFDAQDWMEAGVTQMTAESTGFLGRASGKFPPQQSMGFSTVAVQSGLPRMLKGAPDGLAFTDFKSLKLRGPLTRDGLEGKKDESLDPAIAKLYGPSSDPLFHHAAQSFLQGSSVLSRAEQLFEDEKRDLPKGPLAKNLAEISSLIRSDVGVRLAVTEMGGWDTHVNQGNGERGSLKDRFTELDSALGSFWKSLGPRLDQVCVVVITEFGRTAAENGDRGTDHGHGSTFMVLNGRLRGGRVVHEFKGLAKSELNEGRDLNVRYDYRDVFAEVLAKHARIPLDGVFPGWKPGRELGLFRT